MGKTIINQYKPSIWERFIPPIYCDLGDGLLLFYPHYINSPIVGRRNHPSSSIRAGRDGQGYEKLGEVEEEEDGTNKRSLKSSLFMWCQHGGLDQEL